MEGATAKIDGDAYFTSWAASRLAQGEDPSQARASSEPIGQKQKNETVPLFPFSPA